MLSSDTQSANYSTYNIQDEWINNIATKHFNLEDISLLKSGLFGYVNEVMAASVEDAMLNSNIISNEIFPNKAKLKSSIYNYASLEGYDAYNYKCATATLSVGFNRTKFLEQLLKLNFEDSAETIKEVTINRDTKFIIDDKYSFMLDYDVVITVDFSSSLTYPHISAVYKNNTANAYFTDELTENSSITVEDSDDSDYFFLFLKMRQVSKEVYEFTCDSAETLDQMNFELKYEGKMYDFIVKYLDSNYVNTEQESVDSYWQKLKKYYLDSIISNKKDYYCYYNFIEDGFYIISFSAFAGYFRPRFNSKLKVIVFTTEGADGNFSYNGTNCKIEWHQTDIEANDKYKISRSYQKCLEKVDYSVSMVSDSIGGENAPSQEDLQRYVINQFSMRNNITTDNDLETYLKEKSENTVFKVKKRQDDVIRRLFEVYTYMINGSIVVPTRTADLKVIPDKTNKDLHNSIVIPAGSIFKQTDTIGNYYEWLKDKETSIIDSETFINEYKNYMTTLFMMKINNSPYFVSFYDVLIDKQYSVKIVSNEISQYVASGIHVKRDVFNVADEDKNKYIFEVGIVDIYSGTVSEDANLKVELFLFDKNDVSDENNVSTRIRLRPIDNSTYTCSVTSDDAINLTDEFRIDYEILDDDLNVTNHSQLDYPVSGKYLHIRVTNLDDNKYSEVSTINNVILINDITNIMDTYLSVSFTDKLNLEDEETEGESIITEGLHTVLNLTNIPMVNFLYCKNPDNYTFLTDNIKLQIENAHNVLSKIENNFSIALKFYNTVGRSQIYRIGNDKKYLDNIGISISLNIGVENTSDVELKENISNYILNSIRDLNNSELDSFNISNLIKNLEATFTDIKYIEFNSINDNDSSIQRITKTASSEEDDLEKKLELINIGTKYELVTDETTGNRVVKSEIALDITYNSV